MLPDAPLMVVARIGRLEGVGASVDLQEQVDNVLQAHFMDAGADIDTVAGVKAYFLWWDIPDGVVQHLHPELSPCEKFLQAHPRIRAKGGHQSRVVDLQ